MARARRGYGEGSIFQRNDGRWSAAVSAGYGANGKRIRKTIYGATKKEVQDEMSKLQAKKLTGAVMPSSRLTVGQYLERWISDVAKVTVGAGTFENYQSIVVRHIAPRIGGIALQKLAPAHVQRLYSDMAKDGVRPHGRKLAHCVLHRALKDALRSGMVDRNVCGAVDPPKVTRPEMLVLDAGQAAKLLEAVAGDRLEAMYWIALTTGLRQGELFGLQWQDIDLKAGTLSVCRSQSSIKGKVALNEPKTAKSRRMVTLPPDAVSALQRHRAAMLAEGNIAAERVFCNTDGGPLRRPDVQRRSFKPALKRAALPNIRFHDLRHTSATLLLSLGVHPKVVQERLGHSQISVTMDVYSHVLPGMQRDAANQLGGLLRASGENGCQMAVKPEAVTA